jgi:hypothetical protein
MITTSIYGGLGNQMFQYAIGKSISVARNVDFKMDTFKINNSNYIARDLSLSKFNICTTHATLKEVKKFHKSKYIDFIFRKLDQNNIKVSNKIFEKKPFYFDEKMLSLTTGYLDGYWQSYKYFDDIREVLLNEFTLVNEMNLENKLICKKITELNSISIHIRRGDYVKEKKNMTIYNVFGLEYYHQAIEFISKKISNPYFFVFSDDLDWAKKNLQLTNVTYVDVNLTQNPENDLILMSKCKHNIIANSTFSWWGAWLNQNSEKIIIAPRKWMSTVESLDDLYPDDWIRL